YQLVARNRQVANAHAGGAVDGVGDGGGGRDERRLAAALDAARVRLAIRHALGEVDDLRDVGDRGHLVFLEIGVQDFAQARVDDALFAERIADRLGDAADHLALVQQRIDDAAGVVRGDHTPEEHLAGVALDG